MRIIRGWMNLKVQRIVQDTHDTRTLILVNEAEETRAFDYRAGQYLTFRFDSLAAKPVVRSYTMSSSPNQPDFVAVTVKETANGFISKYLCREVKLGDVLRARGPIGKFCYEPPQDFQKITMIAAGSGVTPFMSIIREYKDYSNLQFKLIVAYKSTNDLIAWDELKEWNKLSNVNIICTLSQENQVTNGFFYGRISPALLEQNIENYDHTTFFTCGPDLMMKMTADFLTNKGVDSSHIKMESFAS